MHRLSEPEVMKVPDDVLVWQQALKAINLVP